MVVLAHPADADLDVREHLGTARRRRDRHAGDQGTFRSRRICSTPAALSSEADDLDRITSRASRNGRGPGSAVDYDLFLDCVHCGLCTSACPTYTELGDENDSPRGRIYLMRAVADGRLEAKGTLQRHLELCLDCRACETACPSGVHYGRLIEPFRLAMEQRTKRC